MMLRIAGIVLTFLLSSACAHGEARKIDEYHWDGVERVVAIGDIHGDYEQYIKVLELAGLVNSRGKWKGGKTHLVQVGDVPDRGPSTIKIIDHLAGLKKQAERKGGRVHTLIGNHEAMNSYGDLRYVTPEEFQAFVGSNSDKYREIQWDAELNNVMQTRAEEYPTMDMAQYRLDWEKRVPLGWVEHRLNWQPAGKYGQWVLGNQIAIMVNDTIFLHGGLSPDYCHLSLEEITVQGREQLQNYNRQVDGVLNASTGPLWYRGLAQEDEDYFMPAVEQILERYGASRIVVGHSPTGGVVWPRFEGKVVVNDTGIAKYYGSNDAWLELSGGKAYAGYEEGRLELPETENDRIGYLEQVIRFKPENKRLQNRLQEMTAPQAPEPSPGTNSEGADQTGEEVVEIPAEEVRPPISPGICLSGAS